MKISKNILFFLFPLLLSAEEKIIEMEESSLPIIVISNDEYSEELIYDTEDNNFTVEMINEEVQTAPKLITTFNENNLNTFISQEEEEIIDITHKASILTPLSYDEAILKAQKEHKIILLEVVATDCKYCEKMEDEVFTQQKIIDTLKKNFVLLRMNGTTQTLPLGMGMTAAPMHIFISENEDIKEQYYGYKNENDFLNILNEQL